MLIAFSLSNILNIRRSSVFDHSELNPPRKILAGECYFIGRDSWDPKSSRLPLLVEPFVKEMISPWTGVTVNTTCGVQTSVQRALL